MPHTHTHTQVIGAYGAPCWRRANGVTRYRGANDYIMQAGGWQAPPDTQTGAKANRSAISAGHRTHRRETRLVCARAARWLEGTKSAHVFTETASLARMQI